VLVCVLTGLPLSRNNLEPEKVQKFESCQGKSGLA